MKIQILSIIGLILFCCCTSMMAQKKATFDCGKTKVIKDKNQKIRTNVYKYVNIVKGVADTKISAADKSVIQAEYTTLQGEYNALYVKIKEDVQVFRGRKKICQTYGADLEVLANKSYSYIDKIDKLLNNNKSNFGIEDIMPLISFLIDTAQSLGEARASAFYEKVKWVNWEDVPKVK